SATSSTSQCRSSRPIRWCPGAMSSWTPTTWKSMGRCNWCALLNVAPSVTCPTDRPFGRR
ncbi:hypothetical protein ATCCBAA256_25200, partial [Mycobacterium montefiorense]